MSNPNAIVPDGGFKDFPERINRNGRPLKIFTILKQSGYTKDDIREAYNEISWSDMDELQRLFKDDKSPAIIKVIAHAYKRAIEKGDYRYVQEIIEQVIGQPKQTVDAKIITMTFDVSFNGQNKDNIQP